MGHEQANVLTETRTVHLTSSTTPTHRTATDVVTSSTVPCKHLPDAAVPRS